MVGPDLVVYTFFPTLIKHLHTAHIISFSTLCNFHGTVGKEKQDMVCTPLETLSKTYVSLGILVRTPWKITKLSSHHSMLGLLRPASETPLNGVSLVDQWWPAIGNTRTVKKKEKKETFPKHFRPGYPL